uniref:Nudix hydrolase n=1 Tax=Brassica oleracea TaxID=3712 RepID=A0A3P6DUA0_BRAOL|nr:unnamed protein product [Brassica oleracea]
MEETGVTKSKMVKSEFVEVIAFRHGHKVAFDTSDLFFICMLKPLSNKVIIDNLEIKAAKVIIIVRILQSDHIYYIKTRIARFSSQIKYVLHL